ncbi:hypothetical protein BN1012_Phect2023 [Candidatus Phaeomarinobacter ectocarpi]|uniref:Uncharacterized protein n=1 Tax=Candidatus Phaeomarinibacter ectocarpi TaxID=1458461 RepID=X5MNN0_9HYPH|nr:hypothetical protein BN1012_Phect2023 [Candidatus Phaeomarinobacter ectocarpi]
MSAGLDRRHSLGLRAMLLGGLLGANASAPAVGAATYATRQRK